MTATATKGFFKRTRFGIYVDTLVGLVLVADQSVKKPGSDETFLGNFSPDLSFDHGELLFSAQTQIASPIDAIFMTSGGVASGLLETVVDTTVTVPDTEEKFGAVAVPQMSNGEVVFWGQGNDINTSGLYTTVGGGGIRLVANRNTPVPDGVGNFVQLDRDNAVAIKDGRIMFAGYSETIDNAPGGVTGIYLWEAGMIRKIVDTTGTIDGRRIISVSMGRESFDGTGLVFTAYLEPRFFGNTFQGVYYVPVSQPGLPRLTIKRVAPNSVRLSWPNSIEALHLDTSTTLLPGSWSGVSGEVIDGNGENAVIETVDSVEHYYRLGRP